MGESQLGKTSLPTACIPHYSICSTLFKTFYLMMNLTKYIVKTGKKCPSLLLISEYLFKREISNSNNRLTKVNGWCSWSLLLMKRGKGVKAQRSAHQRGSKKEQTVVSLRKNSSLMKNC